MSLSRKSFKTAAVLLAGGAGTRMMSDSPKQSMLLSGKSVLLRAVEAFDRCELIDSIVVVTRQSDMDFVKSELKSINKAVTVVLGGASRAESSINGFRAAESSVNYVAIHDVARPFITPLQIELVVKAAYECGAATAVSLVTDTVKEIDSQGNIIKTHSRDRLRRAETPQVFSAELYGEAISHFDGDLSSITDDNMLVEMLGVPVRTVDIGSGNIKLTVPADLEYAEFLLMGDENNE